MKPKRLNHAEIDIFGGYRLCMSDLLNYLEREFGFKLNDNMFCQRNINVEIFTDNIEHVPQVIAAMQKNFCVDKIEIKVY